MPKRKPKQSPRPTGRRRLGGAGKGVEKKKKYEGPGFERKYPYQPSSPSNPIVVYEVKSGGMAGKKSGPPPKSGPTPHGMKKGGIAKGCGKVMGDKRKVTKYY